LLNGLAHIGLTQNLLQQLKGWSASHSVSITLTIEERCKFLREIEREVEEPTSVVVEGNLVTSTVKVITKVKEYVFAVEEFYEIKAYSGVGVDANESAVLLTRTFRTDIVTRSRNLPYKECSRLVQNANITWLLQQLDETAQATRFSIDRTKDSCFTPPPERRHQARAGVSARPDCHAPSPRRLDVQAPRLPGNPQHPSHTPAGALQ
jgi:hypothetical protein